MPRLLNDRSEPQYRMSETLRLSLLALDAILVALGLFLLYVWAAKPKSLGWMFHKVRLTLAQTLWLLGFALAVLLMQIIPYVSPWLDAYFHLGEIFCGEEHQYCFRDPHKPR